MDITYRIFPSFLLLAICILIGAVGQYLLKTGAMSSGSEATKFWMVWFQPIIIIGLSFYFIGALLYIYVLKSVPLSIAYPSFALNTILVVLIGRIFFKETLTFTQVGGILFIILGVVLLWKS